MKQYYFLRPEADKRPHVPFLEGDGLRVVIGPFSSLTANHRWKRLKFECEGFDDELVVQIGTVVSQILEDDLIPTETNILIPSYKFSESSNSISNPTSKDWVLDAAGSVKPAASQPGERTPCVDLTKKEDSSKDPTKELSKYVRFYPNGMYDLAIWHESGNLRGRGTQLWIIVNLQGSSQSKDLIHKFFRSFSSVFVESQVSGWERDLPPIYSEANGQNWLSPTANPEVLGMPILLESLLRIFETSWYDQKDKIDSLSDFYLPGSDSWSSRELALHLGMEISGLSDDQIEQVLPNAFESFQKRGLPSEIKNALSAVLNSENKEIVRLSEPLLESKLLILSDENRPDLYFEPCRLDTDKIVISDTIELEENPGLKVEPTHKLVGLEHLVGRAVLHINRSELPHLEDNIVNHEMESEHRSLIENIAPSYMSIVVKYEDSIAVLDDTARLDRTLIG